MSDSTVHVFPLDLGSDSVGWPVECGPFESRLFFSGASDGDCPLCRFGCCIRMHVEDGAPGAIVYHGALGEC